MSSCEVIKSHWKHQRRWKLWVGSPPRHPFTFSFFSLKASMNSWAHVLGTVNLRFSWKPVVYTRSILMYSIHPITYSFSLKANMNGWAHVLGPINLKFSWKPVVYTSSILMYSLIYIFLFLSRPTWTAELMFLDL